MRAVRPRPWILIAAVAACATAAAATAPFVLEPGVPVEAAALRDAPFTLPPGHAIVGQARGGEFVLSAEPLGLLGGLGAPAMDCVNDVPFSSFPLTPNLLAPAVASVGSQGECTGTSSAWGPVSYLQFFHSGDSGGGMRLWTTSSWFAIECDRPVASAGAGAGPAWVTALEWGPAICTVMMEGAPPSEWSWHAGTVDSWSRVGSTYGLVVV